jgi:hypothetical protein
MTKIVLLILSFALIVFPQFLMADEVEGKSGSIPKAGEGETATGRDAAKPDVQSPGNQSDPLVGELYVKSGLKKQLEMFPVTSRAALGAALQRDKKMEEIPADLLKAMTDTIDRAFAEQDLKGVVLKEFKESLTASEIKEALSWLDSPLGKRITALEEMASTPAAYFGMQQYASTLRESPPTAPRLQIAGRLDSATRATESNVDMLLSMQAAVAMAFISASPPEREMPFDNLLKEMAKAKPAIEAEMQSQIQLGILYTYRDLTDAEIERYIGFLASIPGSKYQSAVTAAMKKAFVAGSVKWGEAIANAAKGKKDRSGA